MHYTAVQSDLGPFGIIVDGDGAVLASGWARDASELAVRTGLSLGLDVRERTDVGAASRFAVDWFAGRQVPLEDVPVRQASGAFIERAWVELRATRSGEVLTYSELARRCGRPLAVRAAAQACARNACMLFVPCHRVLRSDGSLGGFRYGLKTKQWLLAAEAAA